MTGYVDPTYQQGELVGPSECWARAQRALEEAELIARDLAGVELSATQALALADVQARIGVCWVELGAKLGGAR